MPTDDDRDGLSVRAMVVGVMILIAWLCWATAASAYFGSLFEMADVNPGTGMSGGRGRGRGLTLMLSTAVSFVLNSLRIHEAPAVLTHTLQNERWIVLTFFLLMGAAVLFGLWVKKLEAELSGPKRRSGRKRKRRRRD